jgi:hypothetical protein|nr:MAG TPA: hypothetical protein [Caudoviricetes sp.]
MMGWLEMIHSRYHWTEQEFMETGLSYVLDLFVIRSKLESAPTLTPIDQVGIF